MMRSRLIALVAAGAFFLLAKPLHAADSLEDGVADLAQQIVAKSAASERKTLAVSAFPHADDTCSELSNYLVDELVLSLFDVGDGRLQIIERSQLERIFAELELSMSGAIDANTTKELGRLYGVDSLLIGSLTVLGDRLRVISRLIETETGQVFSAAATNIPKTATIVSLMERPAAAGCTMAPGPTDRAPTQSSANATATPDTTSTLPGSINNEIWAGLPQQDLDGLRATVTSAGVSTTNQTYVYVSVSMLIQNTTDKDIRLLLIGPPPQAIDNIGNRYELNSFSGVTQCNRLQNDYIANCMTFEKKNASVAPNAYTQAPRSGQLILTYSFWANKGISIGEYLTISSNFAQLIAEDNDGNQSFKLRSISVGIPNIKLEKAT